ncbi:MAG: zinc ribbon domain-containing protein [Methylococcales bacterium]
MNTEIEDFEKREAEPSPATPSDVASIRPLALDIKKYEVHTQGFDLTDEQKRELLETPGSIMMAFVDLGFGADAVQCIFQDTGSNSFTSEKNEVKRRNPSSDCNRIAPNASGRFQLQAEVNLLLESHPDYPRDRSGEVRNQRVTDLLTSCVYAGYVEAPNWEVSLRPGHHEGLIRFETFRKIENRLKAGAKVPARKNLNRDFPLRGFVTCGHSGAPLTACWWTGRTARYPYYLCSTKGCEANGKSIKRKRLEGEFEALLSLLKPTEGLFTLARMMFEELWNHRIKRQKSRHQAITAEIGKLDKKVEQLLDRIVEANSPSVVRAYENRVWDLEAQKIELKEKLVPGGKPVRGFEETFRTAMAFLAKPHKLWISDPLEDKRAVLKLTFSDRLA